MYYVIEAGKFAYRLNFMFFAIFFEKLKKINKNDMTETMIVVNYYLQKPIGEKKSDKLLVVGMLHFAPYKSLGLSLNCVI